MYNIKAPTHKAIEIKNGEKAVPYDGTSLTTFLSTLTTFSLYLLISFNGDTSSSVTSFLPLICFLASLTLLSSVIKPLFKVLEPDDKVNKPFLMVAELVNNLLTP